MKADIVIGANLGDEGKGTVVANLTKYTNGHSLVVLTNGGSQRAHSILTENGSFTFKHFGSGTYHDADTYYSEPFIINPMQFVKEYNELKERGVSLRNHIYYHPNVRWSTPFDMMANQIIESLRGSSKHGTCGMGIWETVQRYRNTDINNVKFEEFINMPLINKINYLTNTKTYYDRRIGIIPMEWKEVWNSITLILHFIDDCQFMYHNMRPYTTTEMPLLEYTNVIFENGQGLMLNDTGKDIAGTTPSMTDSSYALSIARSMGIKDITFHYVTRPYMTRHGKGYLDKEAKRGTISSGIQMDRTNHYNVFQDDFRYAPLDIKELSDRVAKDSSKYQSAKVVIDITHCDEMDRVSEFKKHFNSIKTYDKALI